MPLREVAVHFVPPRLYTPRSPAMPNRSEYQPLAQGLEDEEETDVAEGFSHAPRPSPRRPGHIDLSKLDTAFKRCSMALISWRE